MKIVETVVLLQLCFYAAVAAVSGNGSSETTLIASPGDVALLPCYSVGNETPILTVWMKNGQEIARSGGSSPGPTPAGQRLAVLRSGSLNIREVIPGDEGSYLCNCTLPGNNTFRARVLLNLSSGPDNVSIYIGPANALPNGTLFTFRGSTVSFNCSASSSPSPQLTWAFEGASSSNKSLVTTSASSLDFRIDNIQSSAQGLYSCDATNPFSHQEAIKSTQLLVYYVPDRHPQCMWEPAQDPSHVRFNCTWFGAYPTPTLLWVEDQSGHESNGKGHLYASDKTDSLSVTLNRSVLFDGQKLTCMAEHAALAPGKEKSCSFFLKLPYPKGEPLAVAQEATSVTLTCTETTSMPPANTTWRKGLQLEDIVPGEKYVLSENGPVLTLTILNVSKEDEGVYFCRSENPLAIRALEVYLTVRTTSAYTGAIIGVFIAALIVGSAAIIAKIVYTSRHRICLGSGFGQLDEDRGDVLSLVESDDEHFFQDAVPRLPPITNGHHTTLVQIHRIPSSDHEDTETADSGPQQQDETAQTDEPADLVTI